MKLYVGNLSLSTTSDDLMTTFAAFGLVEGAEVMTVRDTGRSQGFGFVEFRDDQAAQKAIASLDQSVLNGRTIDVSEAKPSRGGPGHHDGWR